MEEAQNLITTEEGAMVLDRLEAEQWERKHLAREAEHYGNTDLIGKLCTKSYTAQDVHSARTFYAS